jgi:hypothetical protein
VGTRSEARFEMVTERFGAIDVGRRSAPALADLDADGLLDLMVGREAMGAEVFRNIGTRTEARFEALAWELELPPYATPVVVDIDGDGRLEVISGALGGGMVFVRFP